MGVQNPNSTSYVHPDEPNILNLHKAMEYDADGKPVLRTKTNIDGDITITGDVTIPGTVTVASTPEDPVHNHITEVGTSGILNVPYLPIGGNVIVNSGNINANVSGNVGILGNVNVTQGTSPWVVSGNVTANISDVITVVVDPNPITGFYSFNNFGVNTNRGWTMQNTEIPMFAVRVKPGSGKRFRLINYDIGNNNANQSTIGYTWYNAPTITGPAWSWVEIGSTGIQYAIYSDCYGSNTPNGISGGMLNHSGIVIGKTNSDMTPEMTGAVFTDGGMTMVCAVRRMDNATKLDVWFGVTLVTLD